MMERAVLTAQGEVLTSKDLGLDKIRRGGTMAPTDTPQFSQIPPSGIDLDQLRDTIDEFYFTQAMEMAKRNETRAAKLLNLKHHTFRYQFNKLMERKEKNDKSQSW